jgi:saccharopine dehydrogenase (NADP+, L-glutamate forming)
MKKILVLGAGQSAPYLIRYLLDHANDYGWIVTVGDLDPDVAASRVNSHPHGEAIAIDARAKDRLEAIIESADLVVNLLPQALTSLVAHECVRQRRHMISTSYSTPKIKALSSDARQQGVLLLTEMGLDPGIDHMAGMSLIDRVHSAGGIVESYESYGSGVPAPDSFTNPLHYAITRSPRRVVTAGDRGAHYLRHGQLRAVPKSRVFTQTWPVEVPGVGTMEAYPNRDSLVYRSQFGLANVETLIRGKLRFPGWCETWHQVVRLGLAGEQISIPHLAERSFAELVEMLLPEEVRGSTVEERAARFLELDLDGPVMENLRWMGMFSKEPVGNDGASATDALEHLVDTKLQLPAEARDLVIIHHELTAHYPTDGEDQEAPGMRREKIVATLVQFGEPGGNTAMARAVGLPGALAAQLVLDGDIDLVGSHIPTEPAIYRPVLDALARENFQFSEVIEPLNSESSPETPEKSLIDSTSH